MAWKTHGWHPTATEVCLFDDGDAANLDARRRSVLLRRAIGVFHGTPRANGGHAWTKTATWTGGRPVTGNPDWRPLAERTAVGEPPHVG